MANPWIKWSGGECPVDGDAIAEVTLKSGVEGADFAKCYVWENDGSQLDIIAYRLAEAEEKPLLPSKGEKFDQGKPRYDLMPAFAEAALVDVLTFGASKYAPENWRNVKDANSRYIAAAMRHIAAYRKGEATDAESGLPHLSHAACCLMFITELELTK